MDNGKLAPLLPISVGGKIAFGLILSASLYQIVPESRILLYPADFLFVIVLIYLPRQCRKYRPYLYGFIIYTLLHFFSTSNLPDQKSIARESFQSRVDSILQSSPFPKELQLVAKGLLMGSSKELPHEIKERARESGILHLFAASGLHLGVFLGVCFLVTKIAFPKQRLLSVIFILSLGFAYLFALNFPVSFIRAYLFAFYHILGKYFYRQGQPADTLCYASSTIACFFPNDFLSLGFLLSFGAVAGIFYIKPILDFIFPFQGFHFLRDHLGISIACSLATFPILIFYFHSFSYGSVGINIVLVPMASILLPLLYANCILSLVSIPMIADSHWYLTDFFLRIFLRLVKEASEFFSYFLFFSKTPSYVIAYYLCLMILFLLLRFLMFRRKKFRPIIQLSLLSLVIFFFPLSYHWTKSLKKSAEIESESFMRKGFFYLRDHSQLYVYGSCYQKKWMNDKIQNLQKVSLETLYYESETCLPFLREIQKKWSRWEKQSPKIMQRSGLSPLLLSKEQKVLIRFDGKRKSLPQLLSEIRKIQTQYKPYQKYLILDFPPWSKEKVDDWIQYRSFFGISKEWNIVEPEAMSENPLPNT
ncbi:ComEC/Rec2 family competence protein [Leptospira ryugenii]|uniref:ComEC/Rec2 family competence protein n=1 Tax=Leptospira ryugenii TaxID=1917863 RepID=UPI000D59F3A4|nr:ComEC/Rec2 family competence protein [Leptospira ryugenii]